MWWRGHDTNLVLFFVFFIEVLQIFLSFCFLPFVLVVVRKYDGIFVIVQFYSSTDIVFIHFSKLNVVLNAVLALNWFSNAPKAVVLEMQIYVIYHSGLQSKKPFM